MKKSKNQVQVITKEQWKQFLRNENIMSMEEMGYKNTKVELNFEPTIQQLIEQKVKEHLCYTIDNKLVPIHLGVYNFVEDLNLDIKLDRLKPDKVKGEKNG